MEARDSFSEPYLFADELKVMPESKAILVTGKDSEIYDLLVEVSSARDWVVKRSKDTGETLIQLQSTPYDLVVTDVNTPGAEDVALLRRIHKKTSQWPFVKFC